MYLPHLQKGVLRIPKAAMDSVALQHAFAQITVAGKGAKYHHHLKTAYKVAMLHGNGTPNTGSLITQEYGGQQV